MNLTFNEVLELALNLPNEEKEKLVSILQNRQSQKEKEEFLKDIKMGREEYLAGKTKSGSSAELMSEILR